MPVRRNLDRGLCVIRTRVFKRGWVSQKACGARLLLDNLKPEAHNRGVSEVKASHFVHDRLVLLSSSLLEMSHSSRRRLRWQEVEYVQYVLANMP
jgi:hypothetical protein